MRQALNKIAAALISISPMMAFAAVTPPTAVPAPGVLELVGLGAAVGVALALKKRRKK